MGERRKRKSFWDTEEETKHLSGMSEPNSWTGKERHSNHDDGRYHGFSASATTSIPKSTDDSGWASWETTPGNPTALMSDSFAKRRQDTPEVKETGGVNRYYKNMSPGFDGMERRNYNNTFEDDRSHSHRYPVRGRSRSRSRSRSRGRTSGRSRSRSLSRGRGRERDRGRGWSRSRSRSRSRSNGSAGGRTRSRSPIGDYRRQSYGWNDRTRGPDKSSQSCREFVAGSCRRGSQCRFLHPNKVSHRDGDRLEDEPGESWRNRADRSRISKHAYSRGTGFEMQDDVSDPYHEKDEQFTTKGRNAFPCKDFIRGNCRWADTCKFSHHITSGDSFGRGNRVGSFDKDIVRHSNQYGKPICKFFAAGKCDRDNCRFSHEDSKLSDMEGRRTEVIDHHGLHDKSNWLDDAPRVSDSVNPVGWSDTLVPNINSSGGTTSGKSEDRWGHSVEHENKTWGIPEWKGNSLKREKQLSPLENNGSHDRSIGTVEFIGKDHMANKQELLILHGTQLQNQDGILNVQQRNTMQEDYSFSIKALQQNVPSASHIQLHHHGVVENNLVNQFGSNILDGVDSLNTTHPTFFSRQNLNKNDEITFVGHSSTSNEIDGDHNMLCPMPSNEIPTDLNGPERDTAAPLNLQVQVQNHQKAVKSPEMLESKVLRFFPNLLTNEHSTQVTNTPAAIGGRQVAPVSENPPVFLSQRFPNEQSQIYPDVELSSSRGMMPFSETSAHTHPVSIENTQLNSATGSLDLFNPLENGRDTSEHVNHYLPPGTEQNSYMNVKQSSPLSVGIKSENSKVKHPESPKQKQEEVLPNSEDEILGEESKDVKKNKQPDTLDGLGKVDEGSGHKDEKGMRTFKNALIEFVKEILKPTWKEGRMSREVHKTVVKKVVDKVTSTIQVDHIPKTQDKVEHYLSYSKPKITKLVQAYVERCSKTDS